MPKVNTGTAYQLGATPVQKLYQGSVQVWPQAPVLTDITPDSMEHLTGATTLTATGSGFRSGCVLQIKLASASTWSNMSGSAVVSPTQMTGSVDQYPENWEVSVLDGQGRRTAELPFQGLHNTPTLTEVSPISRFLSGGGGQVYCVGANYYAAGSGYSGIHLFMQRPGGGWEDKGALVVQSDGGYLNTIDPGTVGIWQVMVGYDNPNTTRSGQLPFEVKADPPPPSPPTVTAANGFIDPFMGGTVYLTGTNFKSGMTINFANMTVGATTPCNINENYSPSSEVIIRSSTEAEQFWAPGDGHNSSAQPDYRHNVRVTTSDGTSAWFYSEEVTFG